MQGISEEKLKALLRSGEGQQLMQLLSQDGGKLLRQAASAAQAGNYQAAMEKLQPLMATAEGKRLLNALQNTYG